MEKFTASHVLNRMNGCFIVRSGKKCNFPRRWLENFLFLWYAITSSTMVLNKILPCLPNPSSFGGREFENFHSFIFIFTTSFINSLNVQKKKRGNVFLVAGEWDRQIDIVYINRKLQNN